MLASLAATLSTSSNSVHHRRALTDHARKAVLPSQSILELLMFDALVDAADSLSQQVDQTVFRYRALEKEEGARSSSFDGSGNRSLSADHDHLGLGVQLLEPT